ncbi:unnamed protein product [Camellia sinensis]
MRPILMKGHERPLTFLKSNRDGDLFFSCAKDHTPTVWFVDNGERLRTYRGHNGAVWCCDVLSKRDSMMLITGSTNQSAKLWNVQTACGRLGPLNKTIISAGEDAVVHIWDSEVVLGVGQDASAVTTTDHCSGKFEAKLFDKKTVESMLTIKGPQGRINRAVWGPLNKTIVTAGEDAVIRIWNSETGKLLKESDMETGHKKTITSLTKSADSSHLLTGSLHKSAKLWDIRSVTLIKTYVTERPVNAVAMSPLLDHVVLGGGQDASAVTTTVHCAGKFEARFFGKVLQEEIGGVKGRFGPINALAFNPDA